MGLNQLCKLYLIEPTMKNKFAIIDALKNMYHPSTKIIQRLMIFNLFQKDSFLENWFLECVKSLIVSPYTTFSCPENYEDIFDDDSVS